MKRVAALLLALLLSASLAACGTEDGNRPAGNDTRSRVGNGAANGDTHTGDSADGGDALLDDIQDGVDDMKDEVDDMLEDGMVHDTDGDLTDGENPRSAR